MLWTTWDSGSVDGLTLPVIAGAMSIKPNAPSRTGLIDRRRPRPSLQPVPRPNRQRGWTYRSGPPSACRCAQVYADAAVLRPNVDRLIRMAARLSIDHPGMTQAGFPVLLDPVSAGVRVK